MVFLNLPWWDWLLQTIGVILSYTGAEMNARMDISSLYVWRLANVTLFILHAVSGLWLLCVLYVAYFRLSFIAVKKWKATRLTNSLNI
jgi:hypothetical protein